MTNLELRDAKNFGPKSIQWLEALGIYTMDDLRSWDIFELYDALKSEGYPVSRNFLYAVWGALHNQHWTLVPNDVKHRIAEHVGYTKNK